ncbi:MAG: hypothetical protein ABIS29_15505, partial [Vicinamibacterales bacterium]
LHEILISEEELPRSTDLGDYYVVEPHWVKGAGRRVGKEYCSADNLLEKNDEIVRLLAKSDAEFSELGIQGIFLK